MSNLPTVHDRLAILERENRELYARVVALEATAVRKAAPPPIPLERGVSITQDVVPAENNPVKVFGGYR